MRPLLAASVLLGVTAAVAQPAPLRLVTSGSSGAFTSAGGVALASDGSTVVRGFSTGPLDLDGDGTAEVPADAPFVVRYAPSGAVAFARGVVGAEIEALALSSDGDVLLAGTVAAALDLDGDGTADLAAPTDGDGDPFVAALTVDGAVRWARAGRGAFGVVYGLAATADGGAVATGYYERPIDLDGDGAADLPGPDGARQEGFVVRYGPEGGIQWAQRVGGGAAGDESGRAVAVGSDGAVSVCGFFQGAVDLDGDDAPDAAASTPTAVFVARYGAGGTLEWVRPSGAAFCSGLAEGSGAVYAVGTLDTDSTGDLDGDGQSDLPPFAPTDAFAVRYEADGTLGWARLLAGGAAPSSVAVDGAGVVVAGSFVGSLRVAGAEPVESRGGRDGFVARLSTAGAPVGVRTVGGVGDDGIGSVALGDDRSALVGVFQGAADLDGDGMADATARGTTDLFLAVYDALFTTSALSGPPRMALRAGPPSPNPARHATSVPVELAAPSHVRVEVFDALGRRASVSEHGLGPGRSDLALDLGRLVSGVYVVRLSTDDGARSAPVSFTVVR